MAQHNKPKYENMRLEQEAPAVLLWNHRTMFQLFHPDLLANNRMGE